MNIDNDFHKEVDSTLTDIANASIVVSIIGGFIVVAISMYVLFTQ